MAGETRGLAGLGQTPQLSFCPEAVAAGAAKGLGGVRDRVRRSVSGGQILRSMLDGGRHHPDAQGLVSRRGCPASGMGLVKGVVRLRDAWSVTPEGFVAVCVGREGGQEEWEAMAVPGRGAGCPSQRQDV